MRVYWVFHSNLAIKGKIFLRASDNEGTNSCIFENNISFFEDSDSDDELNELFAKLLEVGNIIMPLSLHFRGSRFGMLTDKFGINPMICFEN